MSEAKTNAERQREFRQRKATERAKKAAAGLAEVRGIWAPSGRHAEVREAAAKVLRKATPKAAAMAGTQGEPT
jgi:transcription initiation factor TFIIIB Brf1 subunit/transcription initiation factor TFIIB